MTNRRLSVLVLAMSLAASGCGVVASMTQHWFYGYVASVDAEEICLDDARPQDPERDRCFTIGEGVDVSAWQEGDLVKVRYERGPGAYDGTAVEIADHGR